MKTIFKISLLFICSLLIFSFEFIEQPKVEIVNSNIQLSVNHIELKDGLYLINKKGNESLYVEVKSNKVSGKRLKEDEFQKVKVKGTKYTLNFIEKLNDTGKVLHKEMVFITVWNTGEIDTWNTKPNVEIGKYIFQITGEK